MVRTSLKNSLRAAPSTAAAVTACMSTDATEQLAELNHEGRVALQPGAVIQYAGEYGWTGAQLVDGVYEFDDELGFEFRIEALHVGVNSVQLRACESEKVSLSPWRLPLARADHVAENDPTMVSVAMEENAMLGEPQELGRGISSGATYCGAFLRASVLPTETPGLMGNSSSVRGWYASPQSPMEWSRINAQVPIGDGMLEDLTPGKTPARSSVARDADIKIVVTRFPVAAFGLLNPERLSSVEFAWELLGELLHNASPEFYL